ncbi:MAG: HNH endonuclease signature motif containing protein [Ginsengibacter sp.]
MKRYTIPDHIKSAVAQRAGFKCEYCLLSDIVSFYNFHIDHIISIKHGGVSHIDNLAYCCPDCNYCKGSDIGSAIENDIMVRFFNPRKDKWNEHFYLEDGMILCKTDIANVTEPIFKFNELDKLIYRRQLIHLNQYP